MAYTATRRLEFDAAHRVPLHESKCRALHGHRYVVELTARGAELDQAGRVIDFGALKELVGGWIDRYWDHTTILAADDPHALMLRDEQNRMNPDKPVFLLDGPPTAEVMARFLHGRAAELLASAGIEVVRVRLYETPNCYAEWPG